jgi:ribosomal protein L6P/L9E
MSARSFKERVALMEDTDFFSMINELRSKKFYFKLMAKYNLYEEKESVRFTIIGARLCEQEMSLSEENAILKNALQGVKAEFKKRLALIKAH